jgi:uncharacterized membrane protein YcaP (DUF421 family)
MEGLSIESALGLHETAETLSLGQMALRAIVVYGVLLLFVRFGHKRFVSRSTAFDLVLAIVLGSVASRAVTGTSPLVPTLVASLTLVLLHRMIAALGYRSHRFGVLVKGNPHQLVRDGEPIEAEMRHTSISRHDLEEALREHGVAGLDEVEGAWLERSGNISVVKRRENGR